MGSMSAIGGRPSLTLIFGASRALTYGASLVMKLPHRRNVLRMAAGAAALTAVTPVARAQAYPSRSGRLIVPAAAGRPGRLVWRRPFGRKGEAWGAQIIL